MTKRELEATRETRRLDGLLAEAASRVPLLATMTPINFDAEVKELIAAFKSGKGRGPAFVYREPPRQNFSELRGALERLADAVERGEGAPPPPLGLLYAARARELALEAAICEARETPAIRALAARRYASKKLGGAPNNADFAAAWIAEPLDAHVPQTWSDDACDARSLLVRMRQELCARGLPVRVSVAASLVPLAAAGEGIVHIAPGRALAVEDVERTVLHEVLGHIVPNHRARMEVLGIFSIGTARGSDTQEGMALVLEKRHGFLRGHRKVELAARHVSAEGAHAGADFCEVVQDLVGRGVAVEMAVRTTARAFRGGGLGREAAYLPAYAEVAEALEAFPGLEDVLGRGRVAVDAARQISSGCACV